MANRASSVWDNFPKLPASKVQSNLCKELAVSGGVTTGMHSHLRSNHAGVLESPAAASKSPVVPITGFVKQHSCPDGRQEKISSALAKVIAENVLHCGVAVLARSACVVRSRIQGALPQDNDQSSGIDASHFIQQAARHADCDRCRSRDHRHLD